MTDEVASQQCESRRHLQFSLRTVLLLVLVVSVLCALPVTLFKWRDRSLLKQELARIKAGETDYLINPDPTFADLVTNDPECQDRVRGLLFCDGEFEFNYRDVSDPRLAPLAQLPNLDYATFKDTVGTNTFLMHLQKSRSLTELTLCTTYLKGEMVGDVTGEGIAYVAKIRQLKTLNLLGAVSRKTDLRALTNHPSIETLVLWYHHDPRTLDEPIPPDHLEVISSMPNVHHLELACKITDEAIESYTSMPGLVELKAPIETMEHLERLRKALPHTKITPRRRLQEELNIK